MDLPVIVKINYCFFLRVIKKPVILRLEKDKKQYNLKNYL